MLMAMRRSGGHVSSGAGEGEDELVAAARRDVQRGVPDASDGLRTRAADAAGGEGLETRVIEGSKPSAVESHAIAGSGERLGRYLCIAELGRGGMGRVLRAYDPKLEREVALKVLTAEAVDPLGWARLVREARSLAKLNHPHVVAVYDVVEDPRQGLVIAMELVKGTTLKKWLVEPRSWREVLEAFIEAGRGLAAAHHQGLLHRDFKPANALVAFGDREGTRGPVKVADFGLARRSHETPTLAVASSPSDESLDGDGAGKTLTEAGAVVGTPVYMAPEQHRGDALTSAADQYAFCVALWEALYGERPFGGSNLAEISANVLDGRRRPPPKGRVVPGRLRRACERGMSVDPGQRWPSMEALLTELRKLVAPRTWRWVALTAGLAVLGGGWGVGRYAEVMDRCTGARTQLEGVWDDGRRQEVKAAILGTELIYAPGTWERVEQRLDEYAEAWADKHTAVCEATRVTEEQTEETMELRMRCLRARRTALGAAVNVLAGADAVVVEQAVGLAAGLPMVDRCDDVDLLEQQRQRVSPPEDPQVAQEVEHLREQLADIEAAQDAGKYVQALRQLEPVVQRAEVLGYAPLLAEVKLRRGSLLEAAGKYAEAEQELEAAYTLALEHGHDEAALHAAQGLSVLIGRSQARHAEGLVWGRTALPLAEWSGEDIELAVSLNKLGNVFGAQGEYEQAKLHYQRALQISEKALSADHPHIASGLNNLGNVFYVQGDYEQGKLYHQRALQLREKALGADHPDVAASLNNLAGVFDTQGEYEQGKLHHQRALRILEKSLGADHPTVGLILNNLGNEFNVLGEYEQAKLHYQRALQIREKALGPDHPDVADSLDSLGNVSYSQGEYEQAKLHHQHALQLKEKALGPDHPHLAYSLVGLAEVALAQKQFDFARAHAERAVSIRQAGEVAPKLLGQARFLLAKALSADRSQRARARIVAEQARDDFERGHARRRTIVEVEQWLAEHRAM
jgi:tetratricopeptide (TPR) repeat protein